MDCFKLWWMTIFLVVLASGCGKVVSPRPPGPTGKVEYPEPEAATSRPVSTSYVEEGP